MSEVTDNKLVVKTLTFFVVLCFYVVNIWPFGGGCDVVN